MTYIDFGQEFVQQGWQCPICKRVYAPSIPMCFYCGNNLKSKTSTDSNPEPKDMESEKANSEKESCV